jgi:hypothetical protein
MGATDQSQGDFYGLQVVRRSPAPRDDPGRLDINVVIRENHQAAEHLLEAQKGINHALKHLGMLAALVPWDGKIPKLLEQAQWVRTLLEAARGYYQQ